MGPGLGKIFLYPARHALQALFKQPPQQPLLLLDITLRGGICIRKRIVITINMLLASVKT